MDTASGFPPLPCSLSDLPPTQAHLCLAVERFLLSESGFPGEDALKGQRLLIACSGGADSTALLLITHCLASRWGCSLAVAHLDHGMRPESPREAAWVVALARALDLPCIVGEADVPALAAEAGTGLEEAARHARYAFLETARQQAKAVSIVTAHHADDLTEDVFMRLLRGTGWPALGGMTAYCPQRHLLRPLLVTKKNNLVEFLQALDVSWCEDATNALPGGLRNRLRNEVLPLLKRENPALSDAIVGLWSLAHIDAAYWDEIEVNTLKSNILLTNSTVCHADISPSVPPKKVPKTCSATPPAANLQISGALLADIHQALRLRLYKRCLHALGPGQARHDSLLRLDAAWQRNQGGTIQFPGGKLASISKGNIYFSRKVGA